MNTELWLYLRDLSKYKYLPVYTQEAAVIDYFNMAWVPQSVFIQAPLNWLTDYFSWHLHSLGIALLTHQD